MKKLLTTLLALVIITAGASAQSRFGVKAGLNFNKVSNLGDLTANATLKNKTGFHVGVLYQFRIPFVGLAIQPELLYSQKAQNVNIGHMDYGTASMDFIELPVNIQWGIDLLLFRPFIQVNPFISYAIGKGDVISDVEWDNLNRLDYGVGLGAGVEIWKFQLTGKYSWSLGKLSDTNFEGLDNAKLRGFQVSLALLF